MSRGPVVRRVATLPVRRLDSVTHFACSGDRYRSYRRPRVLRAAHRRNSGRSDENEEGEFCCGRREEPKRWRGGVLEQRGGPEFGSVGEKWTHTTPD